MVAYAELHCLSHYSFLRGASSPEVLVQRAAELNYHALAITDECSLSGVVKAHQAAKSHNIKLIIGSELLIDDRYKVVLIANDRASYGRLCYLITLARRQAEKGAYCLTRQQFTEAFPCGCSLIYLPYGQAASAAWSFSEQGKSCLASVEASASDKENTVAIARWLKSLAAKRCWIGVSLHCDGRQAQQINRLRILSKDSGIPLVATGDVHMSVRRERVLQDTLTAIHCNKPLSALGEQLYANGERHLRSLSELAAMYPADCLEASLHIADLADFSLDSLRYEYPREIVPIEHSPSSWLRQLTYKGAHQRYPDGISDAVKILIEHELSLIAELGYEPFFLTVHDIVQFARSQNILCQGRGSAANSAVCYCLGITAVDPGRLSLLFERFISRERNEPPDIDVDFENARREEVIQYIYQRYGRHRTALAATYITYRKKSAFRDVAKALGFRLDQIEQMTKQLSRLDDKNNLAERLRAAGFDPEQTKIQQLMTLVKMIEGAPRHLSQHVGGFVIARDRLDHLVPIENAAMDGRTVIQWDKDDLEALGLIKVDVLALGMLTAIRHCFALLKQHRGIAYSLATIPAEDAATYRMIQQADTVGVFQIESRAQMSMLPRLKPACFYDLVIEVAIVRPGPIQGDMVHPYLQRRNNPGSVTYPSKALEAVLERTLGVPIFQEQVMQIAVVAADFTPGEADALRRSMAAWKRRGGLGGFEKKLKDGMKKNGYSDVFADQIFRQILGFGDYGFPESHAASFALLAYVSSWLKCHEPAAFCCALLNSQPMGFYAPAQLVADAKRHGVDVRPVDVRYSDWDHTLEKHSLAKPNTLVLRLGMRLVRGLNQVLAERIMAMRQKKAFSSLYDLASRCEADNHQLEALAAADALKGLEGHRHQAHWQVAGIEEGLPLLGRPAFAEGSPLLPRMSLPAAVVEDYHTLGLSTTAHPLALLRQQLQQRGVSSAAKLQSLRSGSVVHVAGLVTHRQRPGTATGVVFVTLEDETGIINLIVWPKTAQAQRNALLSSNLLMVSGILQTEHDVTHVIAGKIRPINELLDSLATRSRDFQ